MTDEIILEQSETMDGRVAQTVRSADGREFIRFIPAEEAYPDDCDD